MQTDDEFGAEHPIRAGLYVPTRFEGLFMHILGSMLAGQSPKNHEGIIRQAYQLAELAENELKGRRRDVD